MQDAALLENHKLRRTVYEKEQGYEPNEAQIASL